MRISFVIPYFYPAWQYGGTPRVAFELARALVEREHSVQVLTTDSNGATRLDTGKIADARKRDLAGIDAVYFRNLSNTLAYRYRLFWPPQLFSEISSRLAKSDIIHLHEFRSTINVPAVRAARALKIPYVISPHGGLKHLGKAALKTGFDAFWGSRMLKEASGVLALSDVEAREAEEFGTPASRIHHVPNPVDSKLFDENPQVEDIPESRGRHTPVVLFLGRLHWVKGADVLLKAFQHLKRTDSRLVLAGPDDGQERELRRLVVETGLGKRVSFAGFLDSRQKLAALRSCDVVVVPSRSEVFSLTAVEALLARKPVLLSSACGLSARLNGDLGVLRFESGNAADLASRLDAMLGENSYEQRAGAAHSFICREFSPQAIAERTEVAYSTCIRDYQNAK